MAKPLIEMPGNLLSSTNKALSDAGATEEHAAWMRKPGHAKLLVGFIDAQRAEAFFTPLADTDVPKQYQATLAKYRKLATDHNVLATTSICYRVRAGFTLKTHAPKAGPCYENFEGLLRESFKDEATRDCLVFWMPCIIRGSIRKHRAGQVKLLVNLRAKLELPAHHMNGFGKVSLVAGLVLAHFKATGDNSFLEGYWVRTDTRAGGGRHYRLGAFNAGGLRCDCWDYGDDGDRLVGVFALGVESL